MPTKLSRYAEGVMEAAWLAAIVVVPVFFNVYSSRIFEPDKIALLRSLALILLAAWGVRALEEAHLDLRWDAIKTELRVLMRTPLAAPVAGLIGVYLIATIFSVTPFTSFWGSYQRLQGTYTTLSYVTIFAVMAAQLRRKAQVERLITTAILTSLPVCLYGMLQRFEMDPIPWGGDVSARIAANLGNSIFIAAFLIMVFPLTLVRIAGLIEDMIGGKSSGAVGFLQATLYIFVLFMQMAALYFSGSRGPWLGWGASLVTLWLGYSLIRRKRRLALSGIGLALLLGGLLILLNIPNGPLETLRSRPEFGRLGQLLDAESRTGRVRTLIWQGAFELVQPHTPLVYPDGRLDRFNLLRPLIGYGPESMYVAYNRFYQPELTQVEKRNASPDRSHNETWDSLVITGLFGLAVYLTLFGAAIYYPLKWLGFVPGKREQMLFLTLYIGLGAAAAIGFLVWKGPAYLGVALPFGMVIGVLIYLTVVSATASTQTAVEPGSRIRAYILLGLVAAVVAHFVEINFGIAISATRVYFYVYLALILTVGQTLTSTGAFRDASAGESANVLDAAEIKDARLTAPTQKNRPASARGGRKKRGPAESRSSRRLGEQTVAAISAGLILALVLGTLGFALISNASRSSSAGGLILRSLTELADGRPAWGILALVLTVWLAGGVLLGAECRGWTDTGAPAAGSTLKPIAIALGVSATVGLAFWIWHAGGLAALNRVTATDIRMVMAQVARSEGLLTRYYLFLFGVVFALGGFLPTNWPALEKRSTLTAMFSTAVITAALIAAGATNLRIIQADISFKTGDVFAKPESWLISIQIYDRARQLAPNEDYYYLFLGRSYLEYAKTIAGSVEREQVIAAAAADLREAQRINPLNTDHTANLARLYSLWTGFADDPVRRSQLAGIADNYFERAIALSPQNSRLWDERAAHALNHLDDPESAYTYLLRALELDPSYDWTYGLLGDYYARFRAGQEGISTEEKNQMLVQAAGYYTTAVSLGETSSVSQQYNYLLSYGSVKAQLGELQPAAVAYERALELWGDHPDRWRVELALAQLYEQLADAPRALQYAQAALATAPDDQHPAIEELVRRLGG